MAVAAVAVAVPCFLVDDDDELALFSEDDNEALAVVDIIDEAVLAHDGNGPP